MTLFPLKALGYIPLWISPTIPVRMPVSLQVGDRDIIHVSCGDGGGASLCRQPDELFLWATLCLCAPLPPPPPPVLCLEKELGSDSVRTCIFGAEGISIGMMQDHL